MTAAQVPFCAAGLGHDRSVTYETGRSLNFSLTNARDDGATDLPRLLRRLADEIERRAIDPIDVIAVTISEEITDDGPWWNTTVVWSSETTA
jgi:hypothetical protein